MININLLPWRIQLQKEQQREFVLLVLISLGICFFICLMMHLYLVRKLSKQLNVNNYLSQQINLVDEKIIQVNAIKKQKNDLINRLSIIHQLQTNRVKLVALFNNFVSVLPSNVYITNIKKHNNLITIDGLANSNQKVSQLMKNIETLPTFYNPVLTEIKDNTNKISVSPNAINERFPFGFSLQFQHK